MKLYGLKDKDGKEYEVTLPDMTVPNAIDNRTFKLGDLSIKPVESETEFHVGNWVIAKEKYYRPLKPRLITSIGTDMHNIVQYNYFDDFDKTKKNGCAGKYLRHATPQEIEYHLKNICEEKYNHCIVRDINCPVSVSIGDIIQQSYNQMSDTYYINGCVVYRQGKFADIVPEKKKLPKTKQELRRIVITAMSAPDGASVDDFMNDYEDI